MLWLGLGEDRGDGIHHDVLVHATQVHGPDVSSGPLACEIDQEIRERKTPLVVLVGRHADEELREVARSGLEGDPAVLVKDRYRARMTVKYPCQEPCHAGLRTGVSPGTIRQVQYRYRIR